MSDIYPILDAKKRTASTAKGKQGAPI